MSDVIIRTNLPDFRRQLREVGERTEKKYVRRSANAAGAVLRALAREKAPVLRPSKDRRPRRDRTAGVLKRAIRVTRNRRESKKGIEVYTVGVRGRVKSRGAAFDPFYWRWQEAGWIPRGPGKKIRGGERTRRLARERILASGGQRVPGRWFLRDAAREGKNAAIDAFFKRMTESFAEESRRK